MSPGTPVHVSSDTIGHPHCKFGDASLKALSGRLGVKVLKSVAVALILGVCTGGVGALASDDDMLGESSETSAIIQSYLSATQGRQSSLQGVSMEVDIDASVPHLQKYGKLHALRNISKLGKITYKVLGFQGDSTVKQEVISRYLDAEQESQTYKGIAITPANYKFKFKGRQKLSADAGWVYVFALSPRKKAPGLFKGEMWLDEATFLPVFEKGRLVKNPSIFFKHVDFERAYKIDNGMAVPQSMSSVIDCRLVGKVQLNVNYTNFEPESQVAGDEFLLNTSLH
jgi:hypothetical protein